jgi:bacterioferritin-associated ferredoxin
VYVCVCLAVSETEVRDAIEGGATTREAVTRACRAGGDCGACHQMIEDMIEDAAEARMSDLVAARALVRTTRAA